MFSLSQLIYNNADEDGKEDADGNVTNDGGDAIVIPDEEQHSVVQFFDDDDNGDSVELMASENGSLTDGTGDSLSILTDGTAAALKQKMKTKTKKKKKKSTKKQNKEQPTKLRRSPRNRNRQPSPADSEVDDTPSMRSSCAQHADGDHNNSNSDGANEDDAKDDRIGHVLRLQRKRRRKRDSPHHTKIRVLNTALRSEVYCEEQADSLLSTFNPNIPASRMPIRKKPYKSYLLPRKISKGRGKRKVEMEETQEDLQLRLKKRERRREYDQIRMRWKNRKIDYTVEHDVGKAVTTTVTHAMKNRYEESALDDVRKKQQAEEAEDEEVSVKSADVSTDEQNQMLESMIYAQTQIENTASSADERADDTDTDLELSAPYSDRFDYWQMGRSVPLKGTIDFPYNSPKAIRARTKRPREALISRAPPTIDADEEKLMSATMSRLMYLGSSMRSEERYYRDMRQDRSGKQDFVQFRLLRKLGAQILTACSGDVASENRILSLLLFHTLSSKSYPQSILNNIAKKFLHSGRKEIACMLANQGAMDLQAYLDAPFVDKSRLGEELGLLLHSSRADNLLLSRFAHLPCDKENIRRHGDSSRRGPAAAETTQLTAAAQSNEDDLDADKQQDSEQPPQHIGQGQQKKDEETPDDDEDDEGQDDASVGTTCTRRSARLQKKPRINYSDTRRISRPATSTPTPQLKSTPQEPDAVSLDDSHMHDLRASGGKEDDGGGVEIQQDATKIATTETEPEASEATSLTPSKAYIHLPGTVPPIPTFPLCPLQIMFGLTDRHIGYHHVEKVENVTMTMALSTVLTRLLEAATDSDASAMSTTEQQVRKLLQECTDSNDSRYSKLVLNMDRKSTDIPLVAHYQCIMQSVGMLSNFRPPQIDDEAAPSTRPTRATDTDGENSEHMELYGNDDNDDNDSNGDKEEHPTSDGNATKRILGAPVEKIAEAIFLSCEKRLQRDGLFRFPRLHLTTALANLCHHLPPDAAMSLARSTDDSAFPTPLEIIRGMLEGMERRREIHFGQTNEGNGGMHAGELEYMFSEASKTFVHCIDLEPWNCDFHLWQIGSLCASLILCSGNQIEFGAWTAPSTRTENISFFDDVCLPHEVRPSLPNFQTIRKQLAKSVRALYQLFRSGMCRRSIRGMASLLEWSQSISLLVGNDTNQEEYLDVLNKQYSYFQHELAKEDCQHRQFVLSNSNDNSTVAVTDGDAGDDDNDNGKSEKERKAYRLDLLATQLENDPGCLEHWKALVNELGALPSGSTSDDDENMHEGTQFWQKNRDWWSESLLARPAQIKRKKLDAAELDVLRRDIASRLKNVTPLVEHSRSNLDGSATHDVSHGLSEDLEEEMSWLPDKPPQASASTAKGMMDDSKPIASSNIQHLLPTPAASKRREQDAMDDSNNVPSPTFAFPVLGDEEEDATDQNDRAAATKQLEFFCCQLLVACHMFGQEHMIVSQLFEDGFLQILEEGIATNRSSNDWKAIVWLYQHAGLDFVRLMNSID